MIDIKDGGPAFPEAGLSGLPNGNFIYGQGGMTLRDYFAAKAMQGILVHSAAFSSDEKTASWAYEYADAMLAARNR